MTNTSPTYNFDEIDQNDRPKIVMGGHRFRLRYPTVEDIESVQKLETDEQKTEALYSFIERDEGEETEFKEVIKKQDIRVFKRFSEMIKKEFGVE
jgi:hypothetical protein